MTFLPSILLIFPFYYASERLCLDSVVAVFLSFCHLNFSLLKLPLIVLMEPFVIPAWQCQGKTLFIKGEETGAAEWRQGPHWNIWDLVRDGQCVNSSRYLKESIAGLPQSQQTSSKANSSAKWVSLTGNQASVCVGWVKQCQREDREGSERLDAFKQHVFAWIHGNCVIATTF